MKELIDKLYKEKMLSREEFRLLLDGRSEETASYLFEKARIRQQENFGHDIYLRGLIEFTNYCKNDCLYCGIRRSNANAQRYRLSEEEILDCAEKGHAYGFRTFVLQGGEDPYFTDDRICRIVAKLREHFPDSAITLSIGEKPRQSYQRYFDAGADRYLLRHETASQALYKKLHPASQTLDNRIRCLYDLKDIGYQIGAGMMLETPYQTADDLLDDLFFLKELDPDMIGIGPFIPHKDTPFRDCRQGSLELTLYMLGILRLMFPQGLIPATTALGTIDPLGREKGILAGANVVMPNLSPTPVRGKYLLYNNKICTGESSAQCYNCMTVRLRSIGYQTVKSRGDSPRAAKRQN